MKTQFYVLDFQYFRDTLSDLNTFWIKRLSLANCCNLWVAPTVSYTGMLLGYFYGPITLFKSISAKYQASKAHQHPCSDTASHLQPQKRQPSLTSSLGPYGWQNVAALPCIITPQCSPTSQLLHSDLQESTPSSEWRSDIGCLRLCKL